MQKQFLIIIFVALSCFVKAENITVLHHKNYYPYAFINADGKADGVLIDYWKLWGEKNNIHIKFIAANENNFIELINNDSAQIISGIGYSDKFSESLSFSEYILRVNTVLFIRKNVNIKSIHEVNFPISALKNYNTKELINEKFNFLNINYHNKLVDLIEKINNPDNKGFIYDYPSPVFGKTKVTIPKGYKEFIVLENDRLRPAVKKGNTDLLKTVVKGSKNITDDEMYELAYKWNIAVPKPSYLWVLVVAILVLTGLLAFYVLALRKQKKQAKIISGFESSQDWQVLIDKGENDYIEFKSSLRWDYRQEKMNKALELIIAKTISAFLNTEGGMLFIGVDDEGNTLGLENDYSTLSKKNGDGFLLAMTTMINNNLGKKSHKFINMNIISLNNKDICIVTMEKSDQPVFIVKGDKDEFYIRASASSQALGIRETLEYTKSHWNK